MDLILTSGFKKLNYICCNMNKYNYEDMSIEVVTITVTIVVLWGFSYLLNTYVLHQMKHKYPEDYKKLIRQVRTNVRKYSCNNEIIYKIKMTLFLILYISVLHVIATIIWVMHPLLKCFTLCSFDELFVFEPVEDIEEEFDPNL